MAIRQSKYIDITSGVGGQNAVTEREMIGRVFTTSSLCGFGHVYEFTSADDVMGHFGSTSDEYKFAANYFGFISKSVSQAKRISFAKWASSASNPYILGTKAASQTVADYTGGNSKLTLNIGKDSHTITVTWNSADDMADVTAAIQSAIQAYVPEGGSTAPFASATVNLADSKFTITLPATVTSEIFAPTANTVTSSQKDLAVLMGIELSQDPILSNNAAAEEPAAACARVDAISDNCGSFCFIGNTLTLAQSKAVAAWNTTKNYKYLYVVGRQGYTEADGSLVGDVKTWAATGSGLAGISGTCLWAYKNADDFIESMPMALFASTDYSRTNGTKTFMYQQNDLIPASITDDKNSQDLDDLFVNYIGTTQTAGTLISFSQDGFNMDGIDTAVYCNEVWMKAKFFTDIMNLFLIMEKVPANDDGCGMIKTVMLDTVNTAIRNGTVTPMRTMSIQQKAYVDNIVGASGAWKTVYENGYSLTIKIEQEGAKYVAKYLLVYLKGDAIRKVEGSDILI